MRDEAAQPVGQTDLRQLRCLVRLPRTLSVMGRVPIHFEPPESDVLAREFRVMSGEWSAAPGSAIQLATVRLASDGTSCTFTQGRRGLTRGSFLRRLRLSHSRRSSHYVTLRIRMPQDPFTPTGLCRQFAGPVQHEVRNDVQPFAAADGFAAR